MLPMQRPTFKSYIMRLAKRGNVDPQGIDFDAYYDTKGSWSENTGTFLDTYPRLQEGRRAKPFETWEQHRRHIFRETGDMPKGEAEALWKWYKQEYGRKPTEKVKHVIKRRAIAAKNGFGCRIPDHIVFGAAYCYIHGKQNKTRGLKSRFM